MDTNWEKVGNEKREAIRSAINEYMTFLTAAVIYADEKDRLHYQICAAQTESAKRVLWMED